MKVVHGRGVGGRSERDAQIGRNEAIDT